MKLITPLKLSAEELLQTTAASDDLPVWEVVGRDFAGDLGNVIVTAAGDDLYVIKDRGPADPSSIRRYKLSTGERQPMPITALDIRPTQAAVSPNGQWLAIFGDDNGVYGIRVWNTLTGARVYQRHGMEYANPGGRLLDWAPDSSFVVFSSTVSASDPDPVAVAALSSSWGDEVISASASALMKDPTKPAFQGYAFVVCALGASAFAFTGVSNHVDRNVFPPEFHVEKSVLGRVDISSRTTTSVILGQRTSVLDSLPYVRFMAYNARKNQILAGNGVGPGLRAYHGTTLASVSDVPQGFSSLSVTGIWVSPDSDELLIRNPAVAPYVRRFVASTYVPKGGLPTRVRWLSYGDDYYVCGVAGPGFALIDRATNAPVEEVYPTVSKGDLYIYDDVVYEALLDNQDRPDQGATASPPTWLSRGAINRLRMFDGQIDSYTEAVGDLEFSIAPSELIDGVALLNMQGRSVRVWLVDGDQAVYDSGEVSLIDNVDVDDWYSYFYSPITYRSDYVLTSLPPYRGAIFRARISSDGSVSCLGEVVLGRVRRLGDLLWGAGVGIVDFSRKERDEFGGYLVVERKFSKRADYPVEVRTNRVDSIQRLLTALRATPAVYIGAESQPETIVYGFYRAFDIVLSGPVYSECNIEVEGLT